MVERFADIKVDVAAGPRDIYSALDGAFDEQLVEIGGTLSPQHQSISQLAPIFQIQVQRVQYDAQKQTLYKADAHLALKETIYLDRYLDSDENSLLMNRRRTAWAWKSQLKELEKRKEILTQTEVL